MYFPILRGRQFELLAIRECIEKNVLSDKVIPIIEPVKISTTYIKTLDTFIKKNKQIAIILNPIVGTWNKDLNKENNSTLKDKIVEQLEHQNIYKTFYVDENFNNCIQGNDKCILIYENIDYIDEGVSCNGSVEYNIIPDKREFRRKIHNNRVVCENHFSKQARNVDYSNIENEFFSADHLFYKDDGYEGFSDYSIIGKDYSESGFAPYAVAIHILYFDEKNNLRVAHFVSDSNNDISDPARKFAEAAEKLVQWNKNQHLNTLGIQELEKAYNNQVYPGLGVVKKYSIMHHLELMSQYLDGVE